MEKPPTIPNHSPLQPVHLEHEGERLRPTAEVSGTLASHLGRFPAFVATVCAAAFISVEIAKSEPVAVVAICVIAVVAMTLAFLAQHQKVV
jgi:hypothetical protein